MTTCSAASRGLHSSRISSPSVCAGTLLLAEVGLLTSRRAITHNITIQDLQAYGVEVVEDKIVDDGGLVTCEGVPSGLDLAYSILEREFGADLAGRIAGAMEYSRSRPTSRG